MNERVKKFFIVTVVLTLIGAAAGSSFYFYTKWRESEKIAANPQAAAKLRAKDILAKIRVFMDLPNEEPTLATVTDVGKLVSQPFFAKAKNGDEVIIFQKAKLAILYDPQDNKVLNVAPVNIGTPSAAVASVSATPVSDETAAPTPAADDTTAEP